MNYRLLDLFCGAGGCTRGYQCAGFYVVGVDLASQPNYIGEEFLQTDALAYLEGLSGKELELFDAIHASPPCQHYAGVTAWRGDQSDHPALIAPTRELLDEAGLPYVIENVRTRELRVDIMLCGSMFGLPLRRHRYFETNWDGFMLTGGCQHHPDDFSFDHGAKQTESVYRDAMGCEWMTVKESRQAIPPAYTEHIGDALIAKLNSKVAAE